MSPRVQHVFACQGCGAVSPKWLGRCPECSEWNTYVELTGEAPLVASETRAAPIAEAHRVGGRTSTLPDSTGCSAADSFRVPGASGRGARHRKSTLLLQAGRGVALAKSLRDRRVGRPGASSRRAPRHPGERLFVAAETDVPHRGAGGERTPALLVVDSIQRCGTGH
jgi:DNA repair protein RadA/Sms